MIERLHWRRFREFNVPFVPLSSLASNPIGRTSKTYIHTYVGLAWGRLMSHSSLLDLLEPNV
jgi:hypothetical protein